MTEHDQEKITAKCLGGVIGGLFFAGCVSIGTGADPRCHDGGRSDIAETAQSFEASVQTWDEHGHGPDPGSEEAARAAAWQLVHRSDAYAEDGFDLEFRELRRISDTPPTVSEWLIRPQ